MILRPQKILVIVLFLILAIGLLSLYSSCHQKGVFIKKEIFSKQLLWLAVGLCLMFLMSRLNYRRLSFVILPLYALTVISLLVVLVSGRAIMGAQRWISLGEFSFQPSEMGKFALILALAKYFSRKTARDVRLNMRSFTFSKGLFLPLAVVLFPTALVLIQPDLGTAVVYLFLFVAIAFCAGISLRYIFGFLAAGLFLSPFFWHFLKEYQKARLLVFLNPNIDPLGAGYTVIQSKIAVGSGRFLGRGWMAGTQSQLNFLAERHTDFIFSVIGEEGGFFGSLILLALFGILIGMILKVAETAKEPFARLLAVGFASAIFFHAFVNISMNIGLCPVVGLPLSFISYGGSSLVINLAAIGIVLNIARQE